MTTQIHNLILEDRLTPIGAILLQDGAAVNLTGKTVKFSLIDKAGTAIVDEANATVVEAATGRVQYSLAAGDVDTAGKFWAYFHVYLAGVKDTYPSVARTFQVVIGTP
jgi:hypothetical protein